MNCPAGTIWLCHDLPDGMNCALRRMLMRQFKSSSIARNHDAAASFHDTKCQIITMVTDMKDNVLISLSKQFAVDVVNLCADIKEHRKSNILLNQLLRSGTSIGANIHEANYASSKADFINKFQIALKECYETDYWLDLFKDTNLITLDEYHSMFCQCSKIRKLLIASITTAKGI